MDNTLKVGDKVAVVKNNALPEHNYLLGKIGTVTSIDEIADGNIEVRFYVDDPKLANHLFIFDPEEIKKVNENVESALVNFDLWLGWYPTDYKGAAVFAGDYLDTVEDVNEFENILKSIETTRRNFKVMELWKI
jgi:hypothetical protein